jgi:metal-responsive CopG/Arc/MetJ family transcriptional regulator
MDGFQLVSVKLPLDMYRAVKRQMKRQNQSMSAIIREALADWLEKRGDVVDPYVGLGGYREKSQTSDSETPDPVAVLAR